MERRGLSSWNGALRVLTCLVICLVIARTLPVTGEEPSSASPILARPLDAAQGIEMLSRGASLSAPVVEVPLAAAAVPSLLPFVEMPIASVSIMAPVPLDRSIHPHWASMRDLFVPLSARDLDKPRQEPRAQLPPTALDEPASASVPAPVATFTDIPPQAPVATMAATPEIGFPTTPGSDGSGSEPVDPEFREPVIAAATPTETPIGSVTASQPDEGSPVGAAELAIDPPIRPRSTLRLPRLTGVMLSSDQDHMAILDGSIVRAGDFVSGFKVKKITRNSVVLKGDGEERVVYVNP